MMLLGMISSGEGAEIEGKGNSPGFKAGGRLACRLEISGGERRWVWGKCYC